jgi:hypothetical protein
MSFKIIPREESRKLTVEKIVGRKVVLGVEWNNTDLSKHIGVVKEVGSDAYTVNVLWAHGIIAVHCWGRGGIWHIDLFDENLQWSPTSDAQAAGRLRGMSAEARLFFGELPTEPHPFLRMRDERKKK